MSENKKMGQMEAYLSYIGEKTVLCWLLHCEGVH